VERMIERAASDGRGISHKPGGGGHRALGIRARGERADSLSASYPLRPGPRRGPRPRSGGRARRYLRRARR
jgi:hypothetical protein